MSNQFTRNSLFAAERADNDRLAREDPAAFAAKMQATLPSNNCAMCRERFNGHGNNARPILDGVVCDDCNVAVLKQRMRTSGGGDWVSAAPDDVIS